MRSIEEIETLEKNLRLKRSKQKKCKKDAVAKLKRLILKHKLTKGNIRGKAMMQLKV